ncbi:hypothetical protein IKW75_03070 [Candidatus Saccharibacteria bacterium]|nr:hypothetical protein [Candidatus Saccharibacteria bacterium]
MYGNEQILKKFIEQGGCILCGSQRCDASLEHAQECEKYQEFAELNKPKEGTTSV